VNAVNKTNPADVADAFEKSGCGWILKYADRQQLLDSVAQEIDEFLLAYERRFDEAPKPFELLKENPPKAAAFFQAFAGARISLEMRIGIWRILLGSEIVEVHFDYSRDQGTDFRVAIQTPYGDREEYSSQSLWDSAILRHLGILAVGGNPTLYGYYALRNP
jgi:hypothetical protein